MEDEEDARVNAFYYGDTELRMEFLGDEEEIWNGRMGSTQYF